MPSGSELSESPSVNALVITALTDHSQRWTAFTSLAHHTDPESTQALANLTRHQDWTVRRAAIAALAQRPASEISRHAVLAAIQDPVSFVRRGVLLAAGELGLTDAAPLVRAALHHADADIRDAALEALGGVWNPVDFDAVWRIHRLDPSTTLRKKAAFVVRANVDHSCWQEVFERWQADPLPRHRQWAIELVEEFGTATDVPRIAHLIGDRDVMCVMQRRGLVPSFWAASER